MFMLFFCLFLFQLFFFSFGDISKILFYYLQRWKDLGVRMRFGTEFFPQKGFPAKKKRGSGDYREYGAYSAPSLKWELVIGKYQKLNIKPHIESERGNAKTKTYSIHHVGHFVHRYQEVK